MRYLERGSWPWCDIEGVVAKKTATLCIALIRFTNRYKSRVLAYKLIELGKRYHTRPDEVKY